jgi:transcriptional antiterminator
MDTAISKQEQIRGGEWLIRESAAPFIPEDFNEEQRMIEQQCNDFLQKEVLGRLDEIDSQKDPKLMPVLLDKAGELGQPHRNQNYCLFEIT